MKKWSPLNNQIFILKDAPVEKTVGGIILPSGDSIEEFKGHIVAVGPEVVGFHVGDHVIFTPHGGQVTLIGGREIIILTAKYIAAIEVDDGTPENPPA